MSEQEHKSVRRAGRAIPAKLPQKAMERQTDRVAELMGDVDLSSVTKTTSSALTPRLQPEARERPAEGADDRVRARQLSDTGSLGTIEEFMIGKSYVAPIGYFKDSPYNARVYYSVNEVEETAASLAKNGQDVAVSAYVEDGMLIIIDGSKRLRAARMCGLSELKVEVKAKPESVKDLYMQSRRMNVERSSQTCFDDAVRFKALLDEGHFPDQETLGRELGGISQTTVSQTLSLNKIKPAAVQAMRENQKKLCQLGIAVEVAKLFEGKSDDEETTHKALAVIREISEKDLSVKQTRELVRSRMSGPKPRQHASTTPVQYGTAAGMIKVFSSRGDVELSIKGVSDEKLQGLVEKLRAVFEVA